MTTTAGANAGQVRDGTGSWNSTKIASIAPSERFKAGEQLWITLSGGDLPLVSPAAPAGVVTIHHGDSNLVEVTSIPV
jgi:hypothetical protein